MAAREGRDFRDDELAYILDEEDLPVYVGKGLGDIRYEDAVELSQIKRKTKGLPADLELISQIAPPPKKPKRSSKSPYAARASKYNPYICDYCGHRTTRYDNMKKHLESVHDDRTTDPRAKSKAVQQGLVETLKRWKGL